MVIALVILGGACVAFVVAFVLANRECGCTAITYRSRMNDVQAQADHSAQHLHDVTTETLRQMTDHVVRRNFPHGDGR